MQIPSERVRTVDEIVTTHNTSHFGINARPESWQIRLRHVPCADSGVEFESRDAVPLLQGVACEVLARRADFEKSFGCLLRTKRLSFVRWEMEMWPPPAAVRARMMSSFEL